MDGLCSQDLLGKTNQSTLIYWINKVSIFQTKKKKTIYLPLSAPPSVTRVTAVLAHSSGELLLLGTEGGHVFIVEVPGFRELEERNISLEQVANGLVALFKL